MNRVLAYLGRFAVILAGFASACLAGSVFLHMLVLGGYDWVVGEWHLEMTVWFSVLFVTALIGSICFLPAMVLIVIAEIVSARGWLAYALSGGVLGVLFTFVLRGGGGPERTEFERSAWPDADLLLAMVAAGMMGGLAYWLVAGRTSGLWLKRIVNAPGPSGS